jgi:hypothetical protein
MAGVLHTAAQRINTSVAGLTGAVRNPSQEPGAPHPASATEVADLIPSEFGGLTHLFGGSAAPSTQFAPVNTARTIPAGSVKGRLGGLVPDVRNVATHAATSGAKAEKAAAVPLSTAARNTLARARQILKI